MVYGAGTAVSTDEQMAYDKARLFAERKLVEQAHAVITTQTKTFQNDTGRDLQTRFETVTRKNAQGQIVGVQQVDSQAAFDGRHYKVYVLIRLPIGETNTQRAAQQQKQNQREAEFRARRAEQEMDRNQGALQKQQEEQDLRMREDLGPQTSKPAETAVQPATTPQTIQLLDVSNEEYRQRRDAALQKPGAVIGHITVR
jgi:type III secretory pathway component EscR